MLLRELLRGLPIRRKYGPDSIEITGISHDSRQAKPGNLFVAIPGFKTDGHHYIGEAVKNGVRAVLIERDVDLPPGVTGVIVDNAREALALVSQSFYGNPSQHFRLIGVTGTNGKTTITFMLEAIFSRAGFAPGLIGTVEYKYNGRLIPATRTTPDALELQQLFKDMRENNVSHVVMEVSSHALALNRVDGCEFDIGVFSNITHDHFDFHRNFEHYLSSKARLFDLLDRPGKKAHKLALINGDDPSADFIASRTSQEIIRFGLNNRSTITARNIEFTSRGSMAEVNLGGERFVLRLKLPGLFNMYNALAAVGAAWWEGIEIPVIQSALEEFQHIPGRYEFVECGQDFTVVIDFAHNPDALEKILSAFKEVSGKKIIVFGAEGGKDQSKRPLMGRVAALHADYCLITSDNIYFEDPQDIVTQVERGVLEVGKPKEQYEVIIDRRKAIERALSLASPGDLVIIAGKGHEKYQVIGDQKIPFSDREIVEELLCSNKH